MQSPAIFASLSNSGQFSQTAHQAYARGQEFDHRIPPPNRIVGMGVNTGMGMGTGVGMGALMMGKGFSGANGLITPGE